jgi:nicotinate-nucleotide adenylyltransferase
MPSATRVGIFGGMFDPIHAGHLDVMAAVQTALALDQLFVLPAQTPPHRPPPVASSYHRFAMAALAISGRAGWQVSDIELMRAGASYTSDTLRAFHDRSIAPLQLFFIAGADAFLEIATWKDYPELLGAAHFAVVSRPGVGVQELGRRLPSLAARMSAPSGAALSARSTMIFLIDTVTRDVSSRAIRQARHRRESITGFVPAAVQRHIEQHGLYEDPPVAPPGTSSLGGPAGRLHG